MRRRVGRASPCVISAIRTCEVRVRPLVRQERPDWSSAVRPMKRLRSHSPSGLHAFDYLRQPSPDPDAVEDERDDAIGPRFDLGGAPFRGVRWMVEAAGRVEDGSRDDLWLTGCEVATGDAVDDNGAG